MSRGGTNFAESCLVVRVAPEQGSRGGGVITPTFFAGRSYRHMLLIWPCRLCHFPHPPPSLEIFWCPCMFSPQVRTCWHMLQPTPMIFPNSSGYTMIIVHFLKNFAFLLPLWRFEGFPECSWSPTLISPRLKCENYTYSWVLLNAPSLKACWSISRNSVEVFPKRKQHFK